MPSKTVVAPPSPLTEEQYGEIVTNLAESSASYSFDDLEEMIKPEMLGAALKIMNDIANTLKDVANERNTAELALADMECKVSLYRDCVEACYESVKTLERWQMDSDWGSHFHTQDLRREIEAELFTPAK